MFRSKNYFKKRIILHYRFIIDIRMDGYIYIYVYQSINEENKFHVENVM